MKFNYNYYLNSNWWKKRRQEILNQRKVCEICGSDNNLQVHHLNYKRLGKEDNKDLMLLCDNCHRKVHTDENAFPYADWVSKKHCGLDFTGNKEYLSLSDKKDMPEEFSLLEVGMIYRISKYIKMHQILKENDHNIEKDDIKNILKISNKRANSLVSKMKQYKVIKEVSINGYNCIAFNPIYITYKNEISHIAYKIFEEELKEEISDDKKRQMEQALSFNMINIEITDKVEVKA